MPMVLPGEPPPPGSPPQTTQQGGRAAPLFPHLVQGHHTYHLNELVSICFYYQPVGP